MTGPLITDTELADDLRITVNKLHQLRRARGWPCIKLGKSVFRFTPAQVEQIKAMETVAPTVPPATPGGQTARSRSRRRT